MTDTNRIYISEGLKKYLEDNELSQKAFAKKHGLNASYISTLYNQKWKNHPNHSKPAFVSKVAEIINLDKSELNRWQHVNTSFFNFLNGCCTEAQNQSKVTCIDAPVGKGKSYTLDKMYKTTENVFYIVASSNMSKKNFLEEIAENMGIKGVRKTAFYLHKAIIEKLKSIPNSLLILDNLEALKTAGRYSAWHAIKEFADDEFRGDFGLIICGAGIFNEIQQKNNSKKATQEGWRQLHSRLSGSWYRIAKNEDDKQYWLDVVSASLTGYGIDDQEVSAWFVSSCKDMRALRTKTLNILEAAFEQGKDITLNFVESIYPPTKE